VAGGAEADAAEAKTAVDGGTREGDGEPTVRIDKVQSGVSAGAGGTEGASAVAVFADSSLSMTGPNSKMELKWKLQGPDGCRCRRRQVVSIKLKNVEQEELMSNCRVARVGALDPCPLSALVDWAKRRQWGIQSPRTRRLADSMILDSDNSSVPNSGEESSQFSRNGMATSMQHAAMMMMSNCDE